MNSNWTAILDEATQPASMRECYLLLEDFVRSVRSPAPAWFSSEALSGAAGARLGYLIQALVLVTDVPVHPSWKAVMQRLKALPPPRGDVHLLVCDRGARRHDDLATQWGLKTGLDAMKIVQLGSMGAV